MGLSSKERHVKVGVIDDFWAVPAFSPAVWAPNVIFELVFKRTVGAPAAERWHGGADAAAERGV